MSGAGGGSGGGGGGAGNDVALELAEVKAEIKELKRAIEVQEDKAERLLMRAQLVELQKEKNRLAEQQQQREQQQQQAQTQGGKCYPCSLSLSLPFTDLLWLQQCLSFVT